LAALKAVGKGDVRGGHFAAEALAGAIEAASSFRHGIAATARA
jgi:hypothetical protein